MAFLHQSNAVILKRLDQLSALMNNPNASATPNAPATPTTSGHPHFTRHSHKDTTKDTAKAPPPTAPKTKPSKVTKATKSASVSSATQKDQDQEEITETARDAGVDPIQWDSLPFEDRNIFHGDSGTLESL